MVPSVFFSLLILVFLISFPFVSPAQDVNSLKAGVVRIVNTKSGAIGTGFIVKINKDRIHIVTSSHVVSGNEHPDIYLYNRQQDPVKATVQDIEEDGLKGLALLTLKSNEETFSGLTELSFKDSSLLSGGEDIRIIGFPNSTSLWTVSSATVARIEGRNLVFSGMMHEGNSGGPVILNGQVIGLVTDLSQGFGYAARSEGIVSYVNGIVRNLIVAKPRASPTFLSNDDFCQALTKLLESSKGGFYSIVGDPPLGKTENIFHPNITIPGAIQGYVRPQEEVYYYLFIDEDKGKVESKFYSSVSKVKVCLVGWEEKEQINSTFRFHKFREAKGTTVVMVYYNSVAQNEKYYLSLSIVIPSLRRNDW